MRFLLKVLFAPVIAVLAIMTWFLTFMVSLGLRNDSNNTWEAILPNGSSKGYPNGQVIKLGKGIKINFGNGNVAEVI